MGRGKEREGKKRCGLEWEEERSVEWGERRENSSSRKVAAWSGRKNGSSSQESVGGK